MCIDELVKSMPTRKQELEALIHDETELLAMHSAASGLDTLQHASKLAHLEVELSNC